MHRGRGGKKNVPRSGRRHEEGKGGDTTLRERRKESRPEKKGVMKETKQCIEGEGKKRK